MTLSFVSKNEGVLAAVPIMATVFIAFVIIGMALPVLPLQVHNELGFNTFVVGIVAGCQFVASLISRLWAGKIADTKGAKYAVSLGLYLAIAGGVFYTFSCFITGTPIVSVSLLLVGRTLLGGAESLIITGSILWGLQLVPHNQSAKVIAWVGMAMFAALAVGAPIGSLIFEVWSFLGIALATVLMTVISLFLIQRVRTFIPKVSDKKSNISMVFNKVLLPGMGFAMSGITFGAITTFLTLLFSVRHWDYGALAFAVFAIMLIVTRIIFGHLPDKFGGARVSFYCLILQAIGMLLIGTASSDWIAIVGAAVSGTGFSLVFPGLGLEAIKRTPVENRGLAMGVYNAFLDVTLGIGSPALGYLAGKFGIESVFVLSAVTAILALPISFYLHRMRFAETGR
jgi:MFS family permease